MSQAAGLSVRGSVDPKQSGLSWSAQDLRSRVPNTANHRLLAISFGSGDATNDYHFLKAAKAEGLALDIILLEPEGPPATMDAAIERDLGARVHRLSMTAQRASPQATAHVGIWIDSLHCIPMPEMSQVLNKWFFGSTAPLLSYVVGNSRNPFYSKWLPWLRQSPAVVASLEEGSLTIHEAEVPIIVDFSPFSVEERHQMVESMQFAGAAASDPEAVRKERERITAAIGDADEVEISRHKVAVLHRTNLRG